ncbi:MAG: peptide/nickel transport system substrate-binding protein [Rhodospirillaceae bacterium]|jgi:peptide/nickel transport system substrate-binding protein|nr:peptide/nickel transport system substrate-binding protein [Rhodospirillaceae bacterium]MEA2807666.1 peptide/nickel transport system substrate-binding protein [Rhodospirillaceae bacterium]MEA2847079.1 peptide/nickel transport system substrate-binding protein [Rhodospirillaceae bacterium]
MNERDLRGLLDQVKAGGLSRRAFVRRMTAVGLTAPMATQLLAFSGVAMAQSRPTYKPTKRGGGGLLKVLWWQGPTLLNPHFAVGTKDQDGSRLFYEPLAGWDADGNLRPILAESIPGREDGTLAADGKSVTWKLKKGVTWHDGKPFTADDCVFTWEYARNPATAAVTSGSYKDVVVEKVDQYTVVVKFQQPTPFWADTFVNSPGSILPAHLFADYVGDKSRDAPTNLKPVGTGPYKFKEFKPGDMVTGVINTAYHVENRPHFDAIEMKGGGDAVSAARAVLQTGEFDFAWNLQVEDEILVRLEKGGKGRVVFSKGGGIEHIQLNTTDPWTEVDGERSSLKTKHPILSDQAVRQALALLVDKDSVENHIYGRTGTATANFINNPERFRSKTTKYEFNVDKANALLDKAGWVKGSDGIRAKDGKKLKFVYQSSVNQPRQKTQAIVKQACQKAGIDIEVKAVTSSVFFSSDVANPDTYTKFYSDLQMYNNGSQPDPEIFLRQFCSWEAATKENKWQGRNITRWQNKEYDDTHKAAQVELDPVKRAAMLIKLNELAVNNQVVIPIVARLGVAAAKNNLVLELSGWDNNTWDLPNWYREA